MEWFKKTMRSWDSFGQSATLNFKGERDFGTVPGGCCSCFLSTLVAMFVTIQLYGFLFQTQYNSSQTTTAMSMSNLR